MTLDKNLHMLTPADVEYIRSIAREVFGESPRGVAIQDDVPSIRARYRYAKLLEDCPSGTVQVWASQTDAAGDEYDPPVRFKIQSWQSIIAGARAGFSARYLWYQGFWDFDQSPECITPCESAGEITGTTLPDATVDEAYSEDVTGDNLIADSWSALGLPEGLEISEDGTISGTPTDDPKTYYVVVQASATKTGPTPVAPGATCTITKVLILKLVDPPPPPP